MVKVAEVEGLTVKQLKNELRDLGAVGYSRMRKSELQNFLKKEIRKKQRTNKRTPKRTLEKRNPVQAPKTRSMYRPTTPVRRSNTMLKRDIRENYTRALRALGKRQFSPKRDQTENPFSLSPGVAQEISLSETYNSLPKSRKSKRNEIRNLDPEDGRGSPTRGWGGRNPQRGRERHELMEKCGKMCFLKPDTEGYPVCAALRTGQGCNYDCGGLQAAYNRAQQHGERKIATRAQRLLNKNNCNTRK